MNTFHLTRKEMANLLLSLEGGFNKTPLAVLQEAWMKSHRSEIRHGQTFAAFISTSLPPIFEKLIKWEGQKVGFSLNDIVSLGNQIEYTHFSITSIQNWVKRDIKDLLGGPRLGKKYSINQAAILFLVDDLKTTLDFESIRRLLSFIFNHPDDDSDDVVSPLTLYAAYTSLYEALDSNNDQLLDVQGHKIGGGNQDHILENLIKSKADQYVADMPHLTEAQKEILPHILVIAMVSVQTAYFQSMAKRFLHATLFLQNLN